MSLSEKDLLKKLLSEKEMKIIECLSQSDDPNKQIDSLLE